MNSHSNPPIKKIAIIGAGPSGLVSAKYALENNLHVTVLEQKDDLGGLWHPTSGLTWESMKTNLSHFSCMFSDLPYPENVEDFPNQQCVNEYLHQYAEKFNLKNIIRFNAQVYKVVKGDNQWNLTWEIKNRIHKESFDFVIIATGVFSSPHIPTITGLEYLNNHYIHSQDYKNAAPFAQKTVTLVGNGFSGTEIATDLLAQAKNVYHVIRTPHWVLPRSVPETPSDQHSTRLPLDLLFYRRANRRQSSEIKFKSAEENNKSNTYLASICSQQTLADSKLAINTSFWSAPSQLAISDSYMSAISQEKIHLIKGNVSQITHTGLTLEDGQSISTDAIIFCTGFTLDLPFFDSASKKTLEFSPDDQLQPLILYKCTFRPELNNLAFVGVYRGPYFAVMELQARWATGVFAGKYSLPNNDIMQAGLDDERKIRQLQPRPQFPHADYLGLADSIAKEMNCLPDFKTLEKENPSLHQSLFRGPAIAAAYRFFDNGQAVTDPQKLKEFNSQLERVNQFIATKKSASLKQNGSR